MSQNEILQITSHLTLYRVIRQSSDALSLNSIHARSYNDDKNHLVLLKINVLAPLNTTVEFLCNTARSLAANFEYYIQLLLNACLFNADP